MPHTKPADSTTVSAIILAGGKSSRMGTDKALLPLNGETLLERLVRIVEPLVSDTIVMLSASQILPAELAIDLSKVKIGRDSQIEQGPLQGIADATALLANGTESVFILSCDLPFISSEWLEQMLHRLQESPVISAVCAKLDDKLNPLIAVYRTPVLKSASRFLKNGKRSCLVLLDHCKSVTIEPPLDQSYQISNINTPDDYQTALHRLSGCRL
jgi:molybdopterin-guanine dinucleotide biosynthesis protein A